ncbi:ABC transporter substrate-binding protein [Paramaledivibacter caminithermalis]|jgi:peptide/nickel transport system substrate-binding protein|uniref:Peptide/nickel transport system substrate-binding protein n=1 Tax=Paramaledivibacter caminithermalis (strain DSM 15212 / CIP 107654 / DViRD3) TaxID=1121301 RepID=A0A1M6RH43_PARC5|nr:ABC transporter substrate-binding protein [Paramaledivibacter caminithermalis]SHK31762.1 peptide/nickel transport system substrate-binding protein [Paramaledivibacter caminithermalis DSM 15212]
MLAGCGSKSNTKSADVENTTKTGETTTEKTQNEKTAAENKTDDLRKETLFITGLEWGPPSSFNYFTGVASFPVNNQNNMLVYETLFMYNGLSGEIEPLLAESYKWIDDYTIEVKLDKRAYFNDGEPVKIEDVIYTYELGKRYDILWSSLWTYIDSVESKSDDTIIFKLNKKDYNILAVTESLTNVPIHPKHIWEKIEKDANYDISEINKFFNESPVASGSYKIYSYDDTKITLVRDDNYWGKSKFGKLPAPKYITHILFKSNDAASLALKRGDLDYSQNFIPNVWKMWEDGAEVRTYLEEAPYYLSDSMPSIYFNLSKPGLDNPDVRRAIAYAIDYKKIIDIAMNGYSDVVEPALTVNNELESKYIDKDAIKPYQWKYDVDKANEILDSIGAKKGDDGIRVLPNGVRLGPWKLECPYGWTDWNATLEIIQQSAKKIGIELETYFPEDTVYENDRNTGNFDIVMSTPADVITPAQPWKRAHDILSAKELPPFGEQAYWNFGRYKNERAEKILELIPAEKDIERLRKLYTELTIIYLKDIPTIPLMYRPTYFFTVNESVWTNFPHENDGTGIPPYCFDGAGIKSLYNLKNK